MAQALRRHDSKGAGRVFVTIPNKCHLAIIKGISERTFYWYSVFYNIISYRGYFSANIRLFSLFSWRTFAAIIDNHAVGSNQVLCYVLGRRVRSFLSWLVFLSINRQEDI